MIDEEELGAEGKPLLAEFRNVAGTLASAFWSRRDNVHRLLGSKQNYSSGVFREGLLRDFLREYLPRAVEVSTGFVYGFERVPTSGKIDMLIWDSHRHAAVYRTDSFVIIPPEAAIAAVSVKSRCEASVADAIGNLISLANLDLAYRSGRYREALPPIGKFILTFACPRPRIAATPLNVAADHCKQLFAARQGLADAVVPVLHDLNPYHPSLEHSDTLDRVLPAFIGCLDEVRGVAYVRGLGPGHEILSTARLGIKRMQYIYQAGTKITTSLEKLVYKILTAVYRYLNVRGGSLAAAWGDFDPMRGFRIGDADEVEDEGGAALLDPASILGSKTEAASGT